FIHKHTHTHAQKTKTHLHTHTERKMLSTWRPLLCTWEGGRKAAWYPLLPTVFNSSPFTLMTNSPLSMMGDTHNLTHTRTHTRTPPPTPSTHPPTHTHTHTQRHTHRDTHT